MLEDVGGVGHDALMQARNQSRQAKKDPGIAQVRANGLDDNPTYTDRLDGKASALGVSLTTSTRRSRSCGARASSTISSTPTTVKKVYVQADAPFR